MPKNTDAEKAARTAKMQEALKLACQVPFEIGLKSLEVCEACPARCRYRQCGRGERRGVARAPRSGLRPERRAERQDQCQQHKDEAYNKQTWTTMQDVLKQVAALEKSVMETTYRKMG